jgi:hypothetical protein
MGFFFTEHIFERYATRPFTAELFANIISNPDHIEHQADGKIMASKIINGYAHRLAYRIQGHDYVLITYYNTSKIEKYLNK